MPDVLWEPVESRPPDAAALEAAVRRAAPGAQVKLTLAGEVWQVRALAPAALCTRGPALAGRDLSEAVARVLNEHDCPAQVPGRRPRA